MDIITWDIYLVSLHNTETAVLSLIPKALYFDPAFEQYLSAIITPYAKS
jgi:hypothetical protein